jgi:hypothetical protein
MALRQRAKGGGSEDSDQDQRQGRGIRRGVGVHPDVIGDRGHKSGQDGPGRGNLSRCLPRHQSCETTAESIPPSSRVTCLNLTSSSATTCRLLPPLALAGGHRRAYHGDLFFVLLCDGRSLQPIQRHRRHQVSRCERPPAISSFRLIAHAVASAWSCSSRLCH